MKKIIFLVVCLVMLLPCASARGTTKYSFNKHRRSSFIIGQRRGKVMYSHGIRYYNVNRFGHGVAPKENFYFAPFAGGNVYPSAGASLGLSAGYLCDCGIGFEGYFAARRFGEINTIQPGLWVNYEYHGPCFSFPSFGIGAGALVEFPQDFDNGVIAHPVASCRAGYYFVLIQNFVDCGLEYRGDYIFRKNAHYLQPTAGNIFQHSVYVVMRFHLNGGR